MQSTLQKELLDLIQQTICLVKEDPQMILPASKEDHSYFNPPKKSIALEIKTPALQTELKEAKPVKKPISPSRWPSIRSILQKIAPHMKLLDIPLDDLKAQKMANAWCEQIEVVIITGPASNEELVFLKDLARAIHDRLTAVKLISGAKLEKEKRWESFFEKNSFKLLLLTQAAQQYTELMLYYQQEKNQHFLATIPTIILEPLETYKQPDQKTALWKSLCQILTPAESLP